MAKAHLRIQMGGLTAAVEAYQSSPTPNVIILESDKRSEDILDGLDQLANYCDAGTRVVIIGRMNDVTLYRELVRRGVSDYLIAPVGTLAGRARGVRTVLGARCQAGRPHHRRGRRQGRRRRLDRRPQYRLLASRATSTLDSVVTDLDLAFGTAGLDFNQDPPQGIAEAVFSPDRIDTAFVDRLLGQVHRSFEPAGGAGDAGPGLRFRRRRVRVDLQFAARHRALRRARRAASMDRLEQADLIGADEILIVAAPDLANLRNTKNLYDLLKAARPNDHRPLYCLNQVGVPKRPEIKAADFAKALEDEPVAIIPFEPQVFGAAANNGQMIAEISADHRTAEMFRQLAQQLTGRAETEEAAFRPAVAADREAAAAASLKMRWSCVRVWQASHR